ncbi:serine hydrolase domain-containing protein [Aestuariivivens sediminis]|uniref:serine hydrolase domain-containing protein n=1 Tax=Aestuariivivens sediminis TaxID=2913557 RepID=UPI001F57F4B0|nr:serine hydrolase [Aestuariivivens sediminis]
MSLIKKILKGLVLLLVLLLITLYLTDTDYLIKAVKTIYLNGYTTAFLEDYKYFDNETVNNGKPQPWPNHKNYNAVSETEQLNITNETYGTIAFLIVKNDSIWFENYYNGFDEDSPTNSFSMAKSYVSGLLGKAIMEGYIKSLDQPVCDFIPEYCDGLSAKLTVGDLASMASGTNWDEAYYSPFSITTRAYFDDDLRTMMLHKVKVVEEPGKRFKYASGDTQLLGMAIENATQKKLYQYLEDCFWKPLGCENETFWQIDSKPNDMVKAYCCIASNAKDFARFGKLYKDYGQWNGTQVLDSTFVEQSVTPRFTESPQYGYGWWLYEKDGKSFFIMRGHLGQMVIVDRANNIIVVRLGHRRTPQTFIGEFSEDVDVYIEEAYKMLAHVTQT